MARNGRAQAATTVPPNEREQLAALQAAAAAFSSAPPHHHPWAPAGGDPWSDPRWKGVKWTVYRGVAYDLTPYLDRHPGGRWLLNLAIGRDCTALFESYHLRPDVAVSMLRRLPTLQDFPIDAVPRAPYPNDSDFYNTVR